MLRLVLRLLAVAAATALTSLRSVPAASLLRSPLVHVQRAASVSAQEGPWSSRYDPASGQTYYYNEWTGETQWAEQAHATGQPHATGQSHAASNNGAWIKLHDDAGRPYYYNEHSGEAQWEMPKASAEQVLWRIDGVAGVAGFSGVAGFVGASKYNFYQLERGRDGRPCQLPYDLGVGDEKALSRWNMVTMRATVSRKQCVVKCQADGTVTLDSEGKSPTLWRQPGGYWCPVHAGDRVTLSHGDQLSLDCNDPEGAVFGVESVVQAQGGYATQGQGGYAMQGQGGYAVQGQGGYAVQGQGGYY